MSLPLDAGSARAPPSIDATTQLERFWLLRRVRMGRTGKDPELLELVAIAQVGI